MVNLQHARRLGIRLALKEWASQRSPLRRGLSLIRHPAMPIRWLTPISFVRQREFAFVFEEMARHRPGPRTILDISSPKLLPISMAHGCPDSRVVSIDILEGEVVLVKSAIGFLGLNNMSAEVLDARQLPFQDNAFDVVTSVSVFEHIAPEQDGEVPAARELGRVLAPGGLALLTVPFSKTYFAEYECGSVYERTATDKRPIFYQRFYDRDLLMKNLVGASGLDLVRVGFIEERFWFDDPHKRVVNVVNKTQWQTLLFGLFYPLLARIFLSAPKPLEQCRKPYIACLILRKPK